MNTNHYTQAGSHCPSIFKYLLFFLLIFASQNLQAEVLTLSCPDDLEVQLMPGECNVAITFDTLVWESSQILTDTVFFPPSGTVFETGNNTVTLAVTDTNGDLEVCTFNIEVTEFIPAELICNQNVSISLNGQCSRNIFPEEFLFMDSTGCVENYAVTRLTSSGISLPPIINANDVNSTFLVVVSHTGMGIQCLTQVTVTGGTPPSFSCPPNAVISCNEPLDTSITGAPSLSGCFQTVDFVFFDERTSTSCPDSVAFQVVRTWIGTDPFGKKDTCEQLITAYRFDIELVDFPPDFDGIFNPPLQCVDSLTLAELTAPSVTGEPTFIQYPAASDSDCKVSSTFNDKITNICGGSYEIERSWTVVKICAPPATRRDTQYIHVVDTLGPVFEIPDTIFVSLSSECADSLLLPAAENVQECSFFFTEIRTPWDTLSTNGGWTNIELSPGNFSVKYELTDMCGNVTLDSIVLVLNNSTLASCPPDVTVTCDYYFDTLVNAVILGDIETLEQLGAPNFPSNCSFGYTETDSLMVNGCGDGSVFRLMVSDGSQPQACLQEVTIEHVSDFEVIFPPDSSICVSLDSVDLGLPIISGVSCENVSFTSIDDISPGSVPDCFVLERRWLVTNSCVSSGINSFDDTQLGDRHFMDGGDGVIEYIQTIEVNNSSEPFFPEGCEIPDLHLFANSCEVTVTAPTPMVNGCDQVELFMGGSLGEEFGANVSLGIGSHAVSYTAIDNCGRMGTCNTFFEVIDTVPPEFECTFIIIDLPMGAPAVNFFANDLVQSGSDNCGSVLYSFSEDVLSIDTTIECCQLGQTPLEIWATDESGNTSTCQTFVNLQDPISSCDCGGLLAGFISTEIDEGIANVAVDIEINGSINGITTDVDGSYSLPANTGDDVTITPSKDINPLNGVSTFDALLITKHILGTEPLDSPYKMIAADFNNSGGISTFDLLEMRKMILNITTEIPNNTSWRFIPADFELPDPLDPFSSGWPEVIQINGVTSDNLELDFIGIKVGDVNNSANPQD